MTKRCSDLDRLMTPFIDGALGASEAAEIQQHLAECRSCRQRSDAERVARELVRSRAHELEVPAPAGLRARCAAAMQVSPPSDGAVAAPMRVRAWVPLSLAASLVIALGAVFVVGQHQRLEAAFMAQLALDHDRCFEAHDGDSEGFGAAEAAAALVEDGWNVAVPSESDEFDLVDARRCLHDGGDMVHLLCRWRGEPVSLFVVPGRSVSEGALEIMGRDAVTWEQDDYGYVLVAKGGPADLGRVASYVQRYTD